MNSNGASLATSTTGRKHGHRFFAALWEWLTRHEGAEEQNMRREVVSGVSGRVLELGFGVGTNWEHLPAGIEYVGIDPDGYMLERAEKHATEAGRQMTLKSATAEDLPFESESFDTVLVTLTFCTVTDQNRALAEALRVLRPGGQIRFLEHVRPEGRVRGRLMDGITPIWRRVGGGCHPNRRTLDAIRSSGFEVVELQETKLKGLPIVMGTAVKPGL
jgi:ubiquinone/menaquinone biosynthesis C-methylase UbiE